MPNVAASSSTPGWFKQGKSLVLYDSVGALAFEIGLLREENGGVVREVLGDASPNGTSAWTLEHTSIENSRHSHKPKRTLKIYGSAGQILWSDDTVDWPQKGEPIVFSNDSKVILIACHFDESWAVEARDWTGGMKLKAGPFDHLISIALAPRGRFAVVRWAVPDNSDTHSFLDIEANVRKDIATSELTPGLVRIGDDGVARSGKRKAFEFTTTIKAAPK